MQHASIDIHARQRSPRASLVEGHGPGRCVVESGVSRMLTSVPLAPRRRQKEVTVAEAKNSAHIAHSIRSARQYLAEHPDDARSTDSEARAQLLDGLRVRVDGPNGWTLDTDMAKAVGGGGSAPSPGWLLRAAVASCDAVLIAMQAAEDEVDLESLEASVTSESDDRGLIGDHDGSIPAGPLRVALHVRIAARAHTAEEIQALVERALRRSPVSEALQRQVPVDVSVEVLS